MVYIRSNKVKDIDYAYLVRSVWNTRKNTSNSFLGYAYETRVNLMLQLNMCAAI
jgi:hypothetical protein